MHCHRPGAELRFKPFRQQYIKGRVVQHVRASDDQGVLLCAATRLRTEFQVKPFRQQCIQG